jgi:predicted RNA-binding Zn ribbon-like protein
MPEDPPLPRSVSGHPALDFVNTAVFSQDDPATDVLRSGDRFLAWADREGLPAADAGSLPSATANGLLQDAVRLRRSMREVMEALAAGSPPGLAALAPLRDAGAEAVRHATPSFVAGALTWEWSASAAHAPLWSLATSALDLVRTGRTDRIKRCPGCGFLLLDATKNGRRRWCSMDDCGTQEKMRRYVAKRAGRDDG